MLRKAQIMSDTQKISLTSGSIFRNMFLFALPLMATNLLQVLFNMSDIAVVGRFAGSIALGSVGSTTTLVTLFTGFLIGFGNAVNVIVAHFIGAKDTKNIKDGVHTSFIVSLSIGIILTFIGELFCPDILELLKTKEELMPGAILYVRIYMLGMPAFAIYNCGNGIYSAIGNTKKPLIYLSISGILNIILNLFFVVVCKMDVAGVALASIATEYLAAFLVTLSLSKEKGAWQFKLSNIGINTGIFIKLLTIGIPSGVQYAIFQIANLFVQYGVNTFDSTVVATNTAAMNADALVYETMAAYYTACGSFIGQNYGAGNMKRVKQSYLISLLYAFLTGAIMGTLIAIFGHQFLSLFTKDPAVVNAAMTRLVIMAFSYGFSALMDDSTAAARGLGKSLIPMIFIILGSCIFRIIWIFTIFAYFRTIESLYALYIFSWLITAIPEIIYFIIIYSKQKKYFG